MKDQIIELIKNNSPEEAASKILKLVVKADVSGQVCSHPDKYFVSGVFGGYWCPKCDRNVDDECEQTLR